MWGGGVRVRVGWWGEGEGGWGVEGEGGVVVRVEGERG